MREESYRRMRAGSNLELLLNAAHKAEHEGENRRITTLQTSRTKTRANSLPPAPHLHTVKMEEDGSHSGERIPLCLNRSLISILYGPCRVRTKSSGLCILWSFSEPRTPELGHQLPHFRELLESVKRPIEDVSSSPRHEAVPNLTAKFMRFGLMPVVPELLNPVSPSPRSDYNSPRSSVSDFPSPRSDLYTLGHRERSESGSTSNMSMATGSPRMLPSGYNSPSSSAPSSPTIHSEFSRKFLGKFKEIDEI